MARRPPYFRAPRPTPNPIGTFERTERARSGPCSVRAHRTRSARTDPGMLSSNNSLERSVQLPRAAPGWPRI